MARLSWIRLRDRIERTAPPRLRGLLALASTLVLLGLITHGHYGGTGDAIHYMVIARSVAFDRDFDRIPGMDLMPLVAGDA